MKKYINKEKDGILTCVLCNQTSKSYRYKNIIEGGRILYLGQVLLEKIIYI